MPFIEICAPPYEAAFTICIVKTPRIEALTSFAEV